MIIGYSATAVREAERPLLDAGEPLMARAAAAIDERVAAILEERGRVRGARVLVLAGARANGGDAGPERRRRPHRPARRAARPRPR